MDPLQIAVISNQHAPTGVAWSALPDAPVVPPIERFRAVVNGRTAVAGALHRLADVVAPPRPAPCTTRRLTA
jgi:hypothetical protein